MYALRLPGQYYDAETGTHYNYYRDYDPAIGRYEQSDPIGGGLNTFAYVLQDPILLLDALGLDISVCFYPHAAAGFGHVGFGLPGERNTSGFYPISGISGPGIIKKDEQNDKACKTIPSPPEQDDCMTKCRKQRQEDPGDYSLTSRQCTSFVRDCLQQCGLAGNGYGGPLPRRYFDTLPGQVHPE